MAKLYIVATPIGNLKDITLRALEVFKSADVILCEDTRVTSKLLNHYKIKKPLLSFHQYSRPRRFAEIAKLLEQGKNLALVVDAGTPGISDPAYRLINFMLGGRTSQQVDFITIPGPSALAAAVSISGFNMDQFIFLGFPPHKKGRKKFFRQLASSNWPVVLYESPHRLLKTFENIREVLGGSRRIVAAAELTKMFERVYRGSLDEVLHELQGKKIRGEWVIIIDRI